MIQRQIYLEKLIKYKDKDIIKVITGIRRCGKSTLFELFKNHLREIGILENQIIFINFEDTQNYHLCDKMALYENIIKQIDAQEKYYLFLDEIQQVEDFAFVVNSLFLKKNIDIYLTGSNSKMMSGEIATLLTGRYVEIQMQPLSFSEYIQAVGKSELSRKYTNYITQSSFPQALKMAYDAEVLYEYLSGIYNTVILKDVIQRNKIANPILLESLIKFLFDNIGNITSTTKITNALKTAGRSISVHTIESYINALLSSFIIYRVGRYDIKGKQHLITGDKYYVADIALRYFLLGRKNQDLGRILENIIFLELKRRGNRIFIGKMNLAEVDFVVETREGLIEYYQVALTLRDEQTLKRELGSLEMINDHNPKYILTLDDDPMTSHNGIKQMNALDWLLNGF